MNLDHVDTKMDIFEFCPDSVQTHIFPLRYSFTLKYQINKGIAKSLFFDQQKNGKYSNHLGQVG